MSTSPPEEMQRTLSGRPRRPTRAIPELPTGDARSYSTSSIDSAQSDHTFISAQGSPVLEEPTQIPPQSEALIPSSLGSQGQPSDPEHHDQDCTTLTPVRAHYLKKELVQLEFHKEFNSLMNVPADNISTFSYLGPPFTSPPKDGPRLDLPFLRYVFRQFVLSFPFLASAPDNFFPNKLQPFLGAMLARDLSPTSLLDDDPENSEEAARYKLMVKLERNFSMVMTSGIKISEQEEVVRLTQSDLNRLEKLAKRRAMKERKAKDKVEINVVSVRTVVEKGRVRSRAHEEFIIRTRRYRTPDVFVSRRYGDFRTLANELQKAHPTELVPQPPSKDRTVVNVPAASPSPSSYGFSLSPGVPLSPAKSNGSMPGMYHMSGTGSSDSVQTQSPTGSLYGHSAPSGSQYAARLGREKNRLTLRSYLHTLLSSSVLGSSPVLRSFLLSGPTTLSEEELQDATRREEADQKREEGRKRFAQEIKDRVEGLRGAVRSVKGELLGKDGLTHVFATIKQTPSVNDLPDNYKAVLEWARISMASTVFQHFIAADNASESFSSMKRIHGMMPYFMLKTALKISNPIAMIRGILDLFLAQPFGGRSLLQRMFTGSLQEEAKAIEEDIEAVKATVEDATMCEKVRLFVYAPREIQAIYKADAAAEKCNVLTIVLRSGDHPALSRAQLQRVMRAHYAHREYLKSIADLSDSDDDEGPQDDDAWLYEDLSILAKLYARLKDREQLISLIFEGSTADLLKDIITIFYAPLGQVYRAASIADSLADLQNFINDLIRTVEQCDHINPDDPSQLVKIFVDLIQRHEQSFYSFVHKVHSKGEGLFDNLMRWIERFLTLMREGLGDSVSLEFLLPHTGHERQEIMQELDEIAKYHYKLKLAYEAKVRRRFGRTQGQDNADAEDEAAAAMVNDVVQDLSFGDLVQSDANDLAAEASDDEDDSSSSDEFYSGSDSDESESDSEESTEGEDDGTSTEGGHGAQQGTSSTPILRSHTVGYSPRRNPHHPTPRRTLSPSQRAKQSLDLPSPTHRPPLPPLRTSRSMTLSSSSPSKEKNLPPIPTSAKDLPPRPSPLSRTSASAETSRQRSSSRQRLRDLSLTPPKKRKRPDGPKPPELKHIPKLLPLFVEMIRPSLRPQPT